MIARLAVALGGILLIVAPASPGRASPACPDPSRPFDYIAGGWIGQQVTLEEDGSETFVGTTVWTAKPILGGCAFEERVFVHGTDGQHIFSAVLLRSFDEAEGRWELTEVDDRGVHVTFLGSETPDGAWGFETPRERDGRAYVLRLIWRRTGEDTVQETFERSWDGGATFRTVSRIDFHRSPGLIDR